MTKPTGWKNCNADGGTWRYRRIVQEFFNGVVEPSLDALEAQINKWTESDDPVALFHLNDIRELDRATKMAFCLSTQSIWERQIRAYLGSCANDLWGNNSLPEKALRDRWEQINDLFFDLRGVYLSSFYRYHELDLLHLLSNVCRHGDGPSSKKLWCRHPEFWRDPSTHSRRIQNDTSNMHEPPSTEFIDISRSQLQTFIGAIVLFWEEIEYIYLENIQRKSKSLEKKLVELRQERAKQGERWNMCVSVRRE